MRGEAKSLYRQLVHESGHFYVCGDVTMAEHVLQTLKMIVQSEANMTAEQVENYMLQLRVRFWFIFSLYLCQINTIVVFFNTRINCIL